MRTLHRFIAHWQNWLGLLLVAVFFTVAFAAPVISPQDPKRPGPIKVVGRVTDPRPHPPNEEAPLGTLSGQISVYHSLIWGTRSAVTFGMAVTAFTAIVGVLIGTTSAYSGGMLNDVLMRITDAFLAFPVIAGVVLIQQLVSITLDYGGVFFGSTGLIGFVSPVTGEILPPEDMPSLLALISSLNPVVIAFILFSWMPYARIMNTIVLQVKHMDYIQASRALGASHSRIIFRHLIPNSIAPVIVLAARDVGGMVLLQATFTFIGMGGNSIWGMLLVKGRDWIISAGGDILSYWWVYLPVTLALILFSVGWNLIGDGLNDVLNPRTR